VPLFKKSKAKRLAKSGDVSELIALITGPDPGKERADAALELPRFSQEIEAQYKDMAHAALTKAVRDPHHEVRPTRNRNGDPRLPNYRAITKRRAPASH
jgi:hypothetical protein